VVVHEKSGTLASYAEIWILSIRDTEDGPKKERKTSEKPGGLKCTRGVPVYLNFWFAEERGGEEIRIIKCGVVGTLHKEERMLIFLYLRLFTSVILPLPSTINHLIQFTIN